MSPRGTDWNLAVLVGARFLTGVLTLFSGSPDQGWVFAAHGIMGAALGGVLGWKLRRVWRRVASPSRWDRRTSLGILAVVLVGAALGSGWAWSAIGRTSFAGYTTLAWHSLLGFLLAVLVLAHAVGRAKRPRATDFTGRRQFIRTAAVAVGAAAAWQVERPLSKLAGLRAGRRRFTGSYEEGSFGGNAFPTTSWVADRPRPLTSDYRLTVGGGQAKDRLELGVSQLDAGDELEATLDCTGGFYSTQRWRGIRLARLVDRAGAAGATHVRVVSQTGYRWSFRLADARRFLLATSVGGEPLSHEHGAPVRLVAPGRRGFQWVKWVVRVELHDGPDPGAAASTVWSSFTRKGAGGA
ncbi:MAG: molybdopterin-dependent oxidoreductase [Solirubrobacteraceae bacterium]